MAPESPAETPTEADADADATTGEDEHFRPIGTIFLLGCFVVTLVLLWASVYLILIDRGVTV